MTACTFGGPELDELFITTSRQGDDEPASTRAAGAVYRYRPGVGGLPGPDLRRLSGQAGPSRS